VFAHLPIGTLAYRINLLSAVFGGVAVALLYGAARQLGCRVWIAATAALAIGFGRVFWSQALLAEVYTLNAAFFAGVLLFLVRWSHSRRESDLILAVAFVALGAAHHLTLVMTIPALTVYALAVDWRRALSRRVVVATVLLACASIATYGYLWVRTVQHAPFLEVQPRSMGELLTIMRAETFDAFLGKLSAADILRERVPLVAGWLGGELRAAEGALLLPGIVALTRRRREAVLLAGSAAVIVAFALDYVVYDVEVFLLIAMIDLGLVAALGLELVAAAADLRVRGPVLRAAAAALVFALVAVGQFRANRATNDQRRHVYENELLDALFRTLPDRSAIVRENYPIDHMLFYKLIGEHAAGSRTIVLIPPDVASVAQYFEQGYHVFAFHDHRQALQARGVEFVDADLGLPTSRSLAHILDTEALTMGYPLGLATAVHDEGEAELPVVDRFSPAIHARR
jgi:hypothetical protein